VGWLRGVAEITGTTYEEVNVYLFLIALPIVLVVLLVLLIRQRRKIHRLSKAIVDGG
jgi:hypothetical protein